MERKQFIRSLSLFALSSSLGLKACSKDEDGKNSDDGNDGEDVSVDESCKVTPSETEGPFPTKTPSSYVRSDIRKGDGVGAALTAVITIANVNNDCKPLEGVLVDIWHCDVNGDYSEYGGTQMQSTNYQSLHWLRGRQVTDANGQVTFQTIFPGWYQSRATHIHAHIYSNSGNSLLVTQIAFQDSLCETVNKTGSSYGYTKGMNGYTYNAQDNVFSDGSSQEMSSVTGSLADGFKLEITIRVKA
ncbi:Dioxygenase [bacterium A37T11]|nr:Dioxygenase [bacterium A37T11]